MKSCGLLERLEDIGEGKLEGRMHVCCIALIGIAHLKFKESISIKNMVIQQIIDMQ